MKFSRWHSSCSLILASHSHARLDTEALHLSSSKSNSHTCPMFKVHLRHLRTNIISRHEISSFSRKFPPTKVTRCTVNGLTSESHVTLLSMVKKKRNPGNKHIFQLPQGCSLKQLKNMHIASNTSPRKTRH